MFIIFLLCLSIWRAVQVAAGDLDAHGPQFAIGLFDPLAAEPLGVLKSKPKAVLDLFLQFLMNIVTAPWTVAVSAHRLGGKKRKLWVHLLATIPFFVLTIALHLLELAAHGCWAIGWFWYLCFVISVTGVRLDARTRFGIHGNVVEDFLSALFFYPCVAVQLDKSTRVLDKEDEENELKIVCQKNSAEIRKPEADGNINVAFKN
jgi:hypothetical protein